MKIFLILLVLTMPVMAVEDVCDSETGNLGLCIEQMNQRINELEILNRLAAYYPFNTNADDKSGNGHHGENHGATLIAGKFGNGYSFDGVKSRIKLPASIIRGTELTVSFWIKTGDVKKGVGIISGAKNSKRNNEYLLYLNNGTIAPHYHVSSKITGVSVNNNIWHMLTMVTEIDQTKVYIDGLLKETIKFGSATPFKIEGLWLGGDQDVVNGGWETKQQFNGILDELRIYNRVLSDSEINSLYKLSQ
jgi:hypothetical protein